MCIKGCMWICSCSKSGWNITLYRRQSSDNVVGSCSRDQTAGIAVLAFFSLTSAEAKEVCLEAHASEELGRDPST